MKFTLFNTQKNDGFIDSEELRNVCWQLNVPIEEEMLFLLMSYCGGEDGGIDYIKFANFLNWKDKMPIVFSASQTKSAMDDKSKTGNSQFFSFIRSVWAIATCRFKASMYMRSFISQTSINRVDFASDFAHLNRIIPHIKSCCHGQTCALITMLAVKSIT